MKSFVGVLFFLIFIFVLVRKQSKNFDQILSMASESPKVPKPVSYGLAEANKICRVRLERFGVKSRIVSQHFGRPLSFIVAALMKACSPDPER